MSDICLILEGTYPYVTGGVSSWVHNLIQALPNIRFSLLTILPKGDVYRDYKYDLPDNVVSVTETFIHDYNLSDERNPGRCRDAMAAIVDFHQRMRQGDYSGLPELYRLAMDPQTRVVSPAHLFSSKAIWNRVTQNYLDSGISDSFIDYFWTWRYAHLPLLKIADTAIPKASVYHAVSTGYAGLLASMAGIRSGAHVILTEHGIYTNERRIEIEQAKWIYEQKLNRAVITSTLSPFKRLWISLFNHLGSITYHYSDEIVTLFDSNRQLQIKSGADPEITHVIPNGINLARFSVKKNLDAVSDRFTVGFVGRVVPIKDVKTFIRACNIVHQRIPNTYFPIMGPFDEDLEYYNECRTMVDAMGLNQCVVFTGRVNVREEYPKMDLVALTSVSEAQPLVILEANCVGVPCVATDVGACSELLNGRLAQDRALGPSGMVTPIASPEATARAIITILEDNGLRRAMGQSGMERVARFYDERDLNFAYFDIYTRHMNWRQFHKGSV